MKKSVAIVLIIVAVVLCSCPALVAGIGSVSSGSSPEIIATALVDSQSATGMAPPTTDPGTIANLAKVSGGCLICLGLIIPLVVGVVTLRMANKKEAAQIPPSQ
jgi:hypothetical protein